MFLKRKVRVTERPRSLNPSKAIAMAICPIIVYFDTWRARSMHDVACEFARSFSEQQHSFYERCQSFSHDGTMLK